MRRRPAGVRQMHIAASAEAPASRRGSRAALKTTNRSIDLLHLDRDSHPTLQRSRRS